MAQKFTISGYLRDMETDENLIGATIYEVNTLEGTATNVYGFYSLTLPAGTHQIKMTYVGYQPREVTVNLNENQTLNFTLKSGEVLEEVVVTAEEDIEQTPQMSTMEIPVDQIKALPVLMGETDILKSIQLLPGIQGGSEGSSGIYVRGGGPDQNLILLDGVPVYNASHLFGFFSVFNADAINKVNVMKGGFPARYGGRLSSVIDISMKEGNKGKFAGTGSIGLISSKLTLEGPIGRNKKTSFILSGRRTYIDLLARPIIKAASDGDEVVGYYFYDVNGKINHTFSDQDRVYLSIYNGLDKGYDQYKYTWQNGEGEVEESYEDAIKWGNTIGAIRWNHVFSPKLFGNLSATYSKYQFSIGEDTKSVTRTGGGNVTDRTFQKYEYRSNIEDLAAKFDLEYSVSTHHELRAGVNVIRHQFRPSALVIQTEEVKEISIADSASTIHAYEMASYVEDDFSIGKNLRANVGLHYSNFFVNGKTYSSLQYRGSLRYLIGNYAVKASYATMTQFIHLLTNAGIGLPTDLWVPVTENVGPQESWQAALGVARTWNGFEISVEAYYKEMKGLIGYLEGASFLNTSENWQNKVAKDGQGISYGAEFFIQKKVGKFTGWIGYTWSKNDRQFEALNFGKKYPYKYDRRHDVSLVGMYKINDRISLSATWVYGTGAAITLPQKRYKQARDPSTSGGYYSSSESEVLEYGERNSYRMKAYHRLDASISFTKKKRWGEGSWTFGVYNLYSRNNPFYIYTYQEWQKPAKFYQVSLFPIIPSVSYNFKF